MTLHVFSDNKKWFKGVKLNNIKFVTAVIAIGDILTISMALSFFLYLNDSVRLQLMQGCSSRLPGRKSEKKIPGSQ